MLTIQQQLNQLKKDKETLNTMLNTMGVETKGDETFTQLAPLVGKIVADPILQNKSVEILENGTTNIVADEGYDGLNNVKVTANIESGGEVIDMYSTEETKTNKVWIDGKPIYRKVIASTQGLNAGSNAVAHNIDNLGMLVHADLFVNFNTHIYTNHVYNSNAEFLGITFITPEDFGIQVGSGWGNSFKQGFTAILEYTKTTD